MRYITTAFIFHKDRLLIVFHKKHNIWLHVGGHLENDETFTEALLREIKEEVNLDVKICNPYSQKKMSRNSLTEFKPFFIHSGEENGQKKTWLDYICITNDISSFRIKKKELKDFRWVTKSEFKKIKTFPLIKELGLKAFDTSKNV